jgi:ABC-type polysaccharide/polyol phosphate transport system ATPase subunit
MDSGFEDQSGVDDETAKQAQIQRPEKAITRDLAISVKDLGVTYRTSFQATPTFKETIVRLGRGQRVVREVKALQEVSFDVQHGTVLGIIGHNGAGKSTLLRAIAGILPPNQGSVEVRGRVSTLLALGVGFNGYLTGRENVILGGLAAGLSREQVEDKFEEIAAFADLGDFIDMPMRTYSSGMYSRLAFSVAVNMDPDILLIDEALSAGDTKFKRRASAKMSEIMNTARTMLLVSHGLGTIKDLCNDCLWMDHGHLMMRGTPDDCVAAYNESVNASESSLTLEDI